MKPFERDHRAAQLSVGFPAKGKLTLSCIVSTDRATQPPVSVSHPEALGHRGGSPRITASTRQGLSLD